MFNKFIADTLTSYLGEYFEIIDHEQVKVSIWNGLVCMQNLKVRKDALRNVDLPVCVLTGIIEELTIRIPWMHLRSEAVVVQIRKARIILADKETAGYGIEQDARDAYARKIRELAAMDKAILSKFCEGLSHPSNSVETSTPVTSQTSSDEDSSDSNFTARLKSIILNNIRVEVEELSVHYTSCTSRPSPTENDLLSQEVRGEASSMHPPQGKLKSSMVYKNTTATHVNPGVQSIEEHIDLSFQIKEMKTYGCNERFEPAFTSPGGRVARQLISFRGLSASLRGEADSKKKLPILKPFDVLMEIVYQPVYLDISTPQYMASLRVNGVCSSVISSKSCSTCYDILQHLLQVRQRQALRRLRPLQGRPKDNPQAWWRYTLDAVQQQVLQRKSAASASARRIMPFSWPIYTSVKRKRDLYMQLYLRQQRTALGATEWLEPLKVDEQVTMAALEIELSIDVLKLGKKLAVERVALERAEYETLLRQKGLVSSASGTSDSRPVHPTAPPITPRAPTSKIGWFSWSWESQPAVSASATVPGDTDSGLNDEGRAELRELVQLMTAERWSEAQRVAIAKEFGMNLEEANALARHDAPVPASTDNSATTDPPEKTTSHHTIPSCVVYLHATALMVELQGSVRGAPSALFPTEDKRREATPAPDTLAQVTLHVFQAGTEWGGVDSAGGSALPAAYYWGTIDGLSLTATSSWLSDNGQQSSSATERTLLSICRPDAHDDLPKDSSSLRNTLGTGSLSDSLFDAGESRASARCKGPRTFSPLESCWSVLPDECHRRASVSLECTHRSIQQLTSKSSALHHIRVKLGKIDLSMDVVPLRHLSDFFFTVIRPESFPESPAAGDSAGNVHISPSTPVACSPNSDFTALEIPKPTSLTQVEQRCTADASVRLAVLRTKLEHQRSIDWTVTVDSMRVSLDEVPQVQGCELTLTQVSVHNATEHRTQRQERLRSEFEGHHSRVNTSRSLKMSTTAALGSLDADWVDPIQIQMAAVRLCVFFPTSPTVSAASSAIKQCVLLPETPMNAVVERNLLGRGHPDLPQWNLRVSSSHPVRLKWSRTSLSVLTTACCLLRDFADSVWFSVGQCGVDEACHVNRMEEATISSFRVRVLPHPTGKKFFRAASTPESDRGASSGGNPKPATEKRESYLEQLHQLSATGERSTSVVGAALPQRIDVRHGVCVVYHAKLSTFPAQYYTLQHGCTHVYRDSRARDSTASDTDSVTAGHRVHLYVSQGGRSHDEALGCDYTSAKRLLVETLQIPPELLENSVFLKDAVDAWLEETNAGEGNDNAPSQEQVQDALKDVLVGIGAVPCRYVAFECASSDEADAVEAALRQCCVSAATPPLLLRPSVQARYNTAVLEPECCKRPLYRMEVSFPSLQITCEGSEPALCSSSVHVSGDEADNGKSSRPDAVLSLTPFLCRRDGHPEKDCYQLDINDKVLVSSSIPDSAGGNSDLKLLEVSTPSNSPATVLDSYTKGNSGAFSMHLVSRKRPLPLPSALHCSLRIGEAARMQLRVGSSLLEWCEAWWDTVGLLTKKLFAEEIIPGYPWWRSHEPLEKTQRETLCTDLDVHSSIATDVEVRWCETKEFAGNERRADVTLTVPVLEVEVDLEGDIEAQAPLSYTPMLRFSALGTSFQWRMTEASHHMMMRACSPQLKWRCSSETKLPPSRTNWVTLMQSKKDPTTSVLEDGGAKLSVDWKLRRPPPMLSYLDWVCAGDDGGDEGVKGKSRMGIRDVQDLKVDLSCVQLFYWHPLLMHLLQLIQEGLVPRALAMVARGPCWFASGTLFCPPLSWRAPEISKAKVSWTHVLKSVTLQSVQLLLPKQVDWIAQAGSSPALPPESHLRLSVEHGVLTDCLQASSCPTTDHSPLKTAVNLVLSIRFSNIVISHAQLNPGCAFHWRLPSLHLTATEPLFDVQCLWRAGVSWVRSLVVELPSQTDPCMMECSNVDLAHVMDLLHANFIQPAALRNGEWSPSMNVLPPASLLKSMVRKNTSTLIIKGNLMLRVSPSQRDSSHSEDFPESCVLRLSGASASLTRSTAGELSFSFATSRLWLGCSLPSGLSSGWSETGGLSVVQVAPKHTDGSSPVSVVSITLRYGWCWLENPEEGSACAANTDSSAKKDIFFFVDSLGVVTVTLNGTAVKLIRETMVDNPHLRKSVLRYVVEDSQSPSRANASILCHDTSGCDYGREPAQQKVQINLDCLQCGIPCSAEPIHPFKSALSTSNLLCPMLKCATSMVQVELCRSLNTSRAIVRIARLLHCILEDPRGSSDGSSAVVIPLVLEQPTEWQVPLMRCPPPHRKASSIHMERAKPSKTNLFDELFGEPPAEADLEPTKLAMQTGNDCASLTISRVSQAKKKFLSLVLDDHPAQLNLILELQPLWLVAPSTIGMEGILSGMRTHVNSCTAALLERSEANVSQASIIETVANLHQSYLFQLRSGSISLFVCEKGVVAPAMSGTPASSLETTVRQAMDTQETLLLFTESATVEWNSDVSNTQFLDEPQTVVHLENISISALQGIQGSAVLLERFSIRVQRILTQSGAPFLPGAAEAPGAVEEWHLALDTIHLTLRQRHYTALLRLALQQTSLLSAMMTLRSSVMQSFTVAATASDLLATAEKPKPHGLLETNTLDQARCFRFHLTSLRVCVRADEENEVSSSPEAVYMKLNDLDAVYYTGQHDQGCLFDCGDVLNERGITLRLAVTLSRCLIGTEHDIPTLVITAASSTGTEKTTRTPCSLRFAQEETTGIYTGSLQVGKVTVTVEALSMMTWVDLLYTPYLQETVKDYQAEKEHLMQQDLWLSKDLVLSERAPLKVSNQKYSLLHLYGNGHTIHMKAARRGQLIFLDEGVTLRIMHAIVNMEGPSIDEYVAAGDGSYVLIDSKTCSRVQPSSRSVETLFTPRAAGLGTDHQASKATGGPANAKGQSASVRWQRLLGEVEVELRIPEPHSVSGEVTTLRDNPHDAFTASNQRTLVLYSHMNLCLMKSKPAATGEDELTAAFDLVHAGVRSEYVAHHSGAALNTTHLVSDWAMKVFLADEKRYPADRRSAVALCVRTIHVTASTGIEVKMRYSDAVFVERSARHAQAAAARLQDAVRRDVQIGLSSLQHGWGASVATGQNVDALPGMERYSGDNRASAVMPSQAADDTVVTLSISIPYVNVFLIDDSHDTDSPLFRLCVKDIFTPQYTMEPLKTSAELRFLWQLEYYEMIRSQWAPMIDRVEMTVSMASRRNRSVMDLYSRKGYLRLSARAGSVKLCFTPAVVQHMRQLLTLRDKFDSTGADALAMRCAFGQGAATASSCHSFKIVQTTGIDVVVQLSEYMDNLWKAQQRAYVLHTGQEWEFSLPRVHGKEPPPEDQKIIVDQHRASPSSGQTARPGGAVISLLSAGIQRVSIGAMGPLQRYIIADVSPTPQWQGQKQVVLRTLVTFTNRLSMTLLQVSMNESGTYDAVGTIPPESSQCIPVQLLRRRVILALSDTSKAPASNLSTSRMRLGEEGVVSLGLSYDSLPCLAGTVLLGVCRCVHDSSRPPHGSSKESIGGCIAVGKNFEVHSGSRGKQYFLLRVQAAPRQPPDVLRYPLLCPLRAVVVTAEPVVTIRNAVGVPLTVTLLTRRIHSGTRYTLLEASPDRLLYTQLCSVVVSVDGSYGVTEVDPLEDLYLSVCLQQSNGNVLEQWPSGQGVGVGNAQYPPACVYSLSDEPHGDTQLVLADLTTGATLLLAIKCKHREVTLYSPHWIINETNVPLQLADSCSMSYKDTKCHAVPIAGLSGRTVHTATVAPWGSNLSSGDQKVVSGKGQPFLYNSLRAEWRKNNKKLADGEGLFVRLWESTGTEEGSDGEQSGWSEWSSVPLLVHETAAVQVISCASRYMRGKVWMLSYQVNMGHQADIPAYSDTCVVSIRPRWVLVNNSPYPLRFAQRSNDNESRPLVPMLVAAPFSQTALSTVVGSERSDGRRHPLLCFAVCSETVQNADQSSWSPPFTINRVEERYVNLVYQTFVSLAEHWPETSSAAGRPTVEGVVDRMPPLRPEDIQDVNGELFVRREEAKVFSITTYKYKGCMMCVQVEEPAQPPLILENRTPFTVCFRQRGTDRISTVLPRRRKAWTWDVPPAAGPLSAEVELWVFPGTVDNPSQRGRNAHQATCVLNLDPHLIGRQSTATEAFQGELEVNDTETGTSSLLFVRVRGVHGISYAVSITMEPTIDTYRTLPFRQLSFSLHLSSLYILCRASGEREREPQDLLLLAVNPVDFSFVQGARVSNEMTQSVDREHPEIVEGGDVQRIALRFRSLQVDDERPSAKERVVAQLVDDKDSGFQIEREMLRITPILHCSVVAVYLTPVELHIEDSFITAMMRYKMEVESSWVTMWPSKEFAQERAHVTTYGRHAALPPWTAQLERKLTGAKQHFSAQEGSSVVSSKRPASTVPLWSRVLAIRRLLVDPLFVSLSLYRSPGAVEDPIWKLFGAVSLLISSTQDVRLEWDPVQRVHVCDTIWHLFFLLQESYLEQMKNQYMKLVTILGINTVRSFVSDLLNSSRGSRDSGFPTVMRRQKPRVPSRQAANLRFGQSAGGPTTSLWQTGIASFPSEPSVSNMAVVAEASTAPVSSLLQVPSRAIQVNSHGTVTVAEVARDYAWSDFMAVAQAQEIKAYGGCALGRALAEMRTTPRYSLQVRRGGVQRPRASEIVRITFDANQHGKAGSSSPRVDCSRCAELEALREVRLLNGEPTPLPHPVHDGFITWEEFAHHINWYEFVDMCTDEEVRTYATLVHQAASEASCNVCILKSL